MGYIYLITNKINNKKYVGKTELSIKARWKQHIKDSKKNNVKQDHCIVPLENMEQNIFPYVK